MSHISSEDRTVGEVLSEFAWARKLTVDLLSVCSADDLQFSLGNHCGPLWKQFRHVGRVQENYMDALRTGTVCFEGSGSYTGGASGEDLQRYFGELEKKFEALVESTNYSKSIDWFGEPASVTLHLVRLLSHETLHHGQLLLYALAREKVFPESWSGWGV